ncbi:MAG: hypothetical protein LBJ73_03275 [Rickettsiales bacterium]|nr:hypothetical protein [Rickettsiales bacterium]
MKNKQLLMLSKWALSIILPAVMLASCGADEIVEPTPQPPVDKCAARGDTTMVFATAADMNNKMTLVNEYLNCGKNVVCQIDFPMALSAEDLNGDYHWMQKSGIGVNFGASGYC